MNMIEKMARAIAIKCNLDPDAISPKTKEAGHEIPEWHFFTAAATGVLTALLEPTEGMVDAGFAVNDGAYETVTTFTAMIQAALDGK